MRLELVEVYLIDSIDKGVNEIFTQFGFPRFNKVVFKGCEDLK
jgi:hypothetical protein